MKLIDFMKSELRLAAKDSLIGLVCFAG